MKKITVYSLLILMVNPLVTTAQVNTVKTGNTWGLAIGVSEYNKSGIENLQYADDDAYSFIKNIKIQNKIALAETLIDKTATYDNVTAALIYIAKKAKPYDIILLHISAHGIDKNVLLYGGELLAYTKIEEILNNSICKNIVVILDVCHAGSSINPMKKGSNITYICSCTSYEKSEELDTLGHGLFTFYILEGITNCNADINKDNIITNKELFIYSTKKISNIQHPVMSNNTEKPVIIKK